MLKIFLLALVSSAYASIPYTEDGISCKNSATLVEGLCTDACKRTKDAIEGTKGCDTIARNIYDLQLQIPLPGVTDVVAMDLEYTNKKLKTILSPESCLHDLELLYELREHACTVGNSPSPEQITASALRRFSLHYMHMKSYDAEKRATYCFPAMVRIMERASNLSKGVSPSLFHNCPDPVNTKWDETSCTPECWNNMKKFISEIGYEKDPCCISSYYEEIYAFTYGNGRTADGDHAVKILTKPKDAVQFCVDKYEKASNANYEKYYADYCSGASRNSVFTWLIVAALVLLTTFSEIF